MKLNLFHIALIFTASVLFVSCNHKQTGNVLSSDKEVKEDKDAPYIEGNKKILQWENEEIDLFIKRYGWKMTQTGTGLHVEILTSGKGDKYQEGDHIAIQYKTFLLTGEKVYDSEQNGIKEFTVGRSEEITGLHEAVQLMSPGTKARLVIPSYLAYGVAGDGDQIQGRKPIAMTIEILSEE